MPWVAVLARLVVGGVWLAAGLLKVPDPAENVRAVRAYRLLPEAVGVLVRLNAVLSAVLLLAFITGIASAWGRGLAIDCGCFGGGGGPSENAEAKYPWELARDFGLLLFSGWLIRRPRSPWALDNLLFPATAD